MCGTGRGGDGCRLVEDGVPTVGVGVLCEKGEGNARGTGNLGRGGMRGKVAGGACARDWYCLCCRRRWYTSGQLGAEWTEDGVMWFGGVVRGAWADGCSVGVRRVVLGG